MNRKNSLHYLLLIPFFLGLFSQAAMSSTESLEGFCTENVWLDKKEIAANLCAQGNYDRAGIDQALLRFKNRMSAKNPQELNESLHLIEDAVSNYAAKKDDDGIELCAQLLQELADPSKVNQGNHNTCALAALETKLYTELPSAVCRIVFDAKSGTVRAADGVACIVPQTCTKPDREARCYTPGSVHRSYPSQLFQIAVANMYWQRQSKDPRGIKVPPGSITYIQLDEPPTFPSDTGERLIINWASDIRESVAGQNCMPECSPSFSMACIKQSYQMITGRGQEEFLLAHKSQNQNKPALLFSNENDLCKKLASLKASGNLPAIIAIHPNGQFLQTVPRLTLRSVSGKSLPLQNHGSWHVVCINDFHEDSREVNIDNFWGPSSDFLDGRRLTISQLHSSAYPNSSAK